MVISDDMQMGAIADNFGFEESIIRAINTGCDILIISNNLQTYDEQIPYKDMKRQSKVDKFRRKN